MSVAGDPLSSRGRQIGKAFAGGETCQQIADRLTLAPSTVRTHLATIYRKLGVSTKLDLRRRIEASASADPASDLLPRPDKPSIAVLAFANMSDDPGQEYFSDAITADIITALSLYACTVPGSPKEHRVAAGKAELGLGIHGEAGVQQIDYHNAEQAMAAVTVKLASAMEPGSHVVLLNNLGGATELEMSILANDLVKSVIGDQLQLIVGPAAMMTSLDMRGLRSGQDCRLFSSDPKAAPQGRRRQRTDGRFQPHLQVTAQGSPSDQKPARGPPGRKLTAALTGSVRHAIAR